MFSEKILIPPLVRGRLCIAQTVSSCQDRFSSDNQSQNTLIIPVGTPLFSTVDYLTNTPPSLLWYS